MENPSREACPRLVAFAIAVQPQENLLSQILGLMPIRKAAMQAAEDSVLKIAHEFRERAGLVPLHAEHECDLGVVARERNRSLRRGVGDFHTGTSLRGEAEYAESVSAGSPTNGRRIVNVVPTPVWLTTAIDPFIKSR